MRWFDAMVFMDCDKCSRADSNLLVRRLKEGLSILSGLQQGGRKLASSTALDRIDLEDVVHDIATALLGKEITIGNDLPYPGKLGFVRHSKSGRRVKGA